MSLLPVPLPASASALPEDLSSYETGDSGIPEGLAARFGKGTPKEWERILDNLGRRDQRLSTLDAWWALESGGAKAEAILAGTRAQEAIDDNGWTGPLFPEEPNAATVFEALTSKMDEYHVPRGRVLVALLYWRAS